MIIYIVINVEHGRLVCWIPLHFNPFMIFAHLPGLSPYLKSQVCRPNENSQFKIGAVIQRAKVVPVPVLKLHVPTVQCRFQRTKWFDVLALHALGELIGRYRGHDQRCAPRRSIFTVVNLYTVGVSDPVHGRHNLALESYNELLVRESQRLP
jgi:hypothetical protein